MSNIYPYTWTSFVNKFRVITLVLTAGVCIGVVVGLLSSLYNGVVFLLFLMLAIQLVFPMNKLAKMIKGKPLFDVNEIVKPPLFKWW